MFNKNSRLESGAKKSIIDDILLLSKFLSLESLGLKVYCHGHSLYSHLISRVPFEEKVDSNVAGEGGTADVGSSEVLVGVEVGSLGVDNALPDSTDSVGHFTWFKCINE